VGAAAVSRQVTLNAVQAGMTRLRDKGGANPNSLYELTNGYVTAARTMRVRPGTVQAFSVPGTKGLAVYRGELVVFSHQPVSVPSGVTLEIVRHPTIPTLALSTIHFAAPIMGFLYVVAQFVNGDVFHYWLERIQPWTPGAQIKPGQTISPTTPNGYVYTATRTQQPRQTWAAGVPRAVGDQVEPTNVNGFYFEVVEVRGPSPASGSAEPAWLAQSGAVTIESNEIAQTQEQPQDSNNFTDQSNATGDYINSRYGTIPGFTGRYFRE
jgi:hypothetical protein